MTPVPRPAFTGGAHIRPGPGPASPPARPAASPVPAQARGSTRCAAAPPAGTGAARPPYRPSRPAGPARGTPGGSTRSRRGHVTAWPNSAERAATTGEQDAPGSGPPRGTRAAGSPRAGVPGVGGRAHAAQDRRRRGGGRRGSRTGRTRHGNRTRSRTHTGRARKPYAPGPARKPDTPGPARKPDPPKAGGVYEGAGRPPGVLAWRSERRPGHVVAVRRRDARPRGRPDPSASG